MSLPVLAHSVLTPGQAVAQAQGIQINEIQVTGNQRVDAATVLSFAGIERGQIVTEGEINNIFQRVLGSGLFEEVSVTPQGNRLVIDVKEFPTINRISIEGNRRIDDDTLLPLIGSQPRLIYSPSQAEADAAVITDAYSQAGRLAATVTPQIIRRSENRVDLIFEVEEGNVIENERISFVGNRAFSDRRLRRILATKEAGLLRQIIQRDTFIEDRIEFDRQLLTDFYRSRGYIDFRVVSVTPQLTQDRGAVFITFNLIEGRKYAFNEVTVSSELSEVNIAEYAPIVGIRNGDTYNPALLDRAISRLENQASESGLNFIRAAPQITRDDANSVLNVNFVLERGPRIFVERIDIEGNATTLDRVIRNQFDTVEGDPFNPREIREATERLRALRFFSDTSVETREGSGPDRLIVDVDVVEQPTGSLSFGGTFSVDDGFGIVVSLVERNFLGRGQTVGLSFNTTEGNRSLSANFAEPNFLDRDVVFSTNVGVLRTGGNNQLFDTSEAVIDFGTGFAVSENGFLRTSIGWERLELSGLDEERSSPILLREQGAEQGFVIGYDYIFDTRGRGLDPTSGVTFTFGQSIEGLEADGAFLRTEASIVGERSTLSEEVLFRAALEGGVITAFGEGTTRVTDRFRLPRSQLRGFSNRGVGPRDTAAPNDDALGGKFYSALRLETVFPSFLPEEYNIDLALFADAGSLWGLDDTDGFNGVPVDDEFILRAVVGFGVLWQSPIGPLRFNFTSAQRKEDYDRESNFDFTVGVRF